MNPRITKYRVWDKRKDSRTYGMSYNAENSCNWHDFLDYPKYYTLMQFTGVKDKVGDEIYEGDILGYINKESNIITEKVEVYYDLDYCSFKISTKYFNGPLNKNQLSNVKIIGNIFETPELLNT